jgi:thiamine biosynthesis protein ThiS
MMILAQGRKIPWREGMTISDVLTELGDNQHCAVVKVNGRIYCGPDFEKTAVPDGSEVFLIPLVAGG